MLRYSESRDALSLDLVLVPGRFRRLGVGSLLIRRLLVLADALGKPVLTTARPIGGYSAEALERLVRYYASFGFHPQHRGLTAVHMRRLPGGAPPDRGSRGEGET